MKSAIITTAGAVPVWKEFSEKPVPAADKLLLKMDAAAIKNLDKLRASGKHYSLSFADGKPQIAGMDGVGVAENGERYYAVSMKGIISEYVAIDKKNLVPLPQDLDASFAAALPNAIMGSALALKFRAKMQPGATILINGVTGVTGRIAVAVAKHYGAAKIIGTGRNQHSLDEISRKENIETILIDTNYTRFFESLEKIETENPVDIVLDYLWGQPAENILKSLKGKGQYTHATQFVTVGSMAGENIQLPSGLLRGTDITLTGSGIGSWTDAEMAAFYSEILPEMFQLAAEGKLTMPIEKRDIQHIQTLWNDEPGNGTRVVYQFP